jgi:hypothetical protein
MYHAPTIVRPYIYSCTVTVYVAIAAVEPESSNLHKYYRIYVYMIED